MLTFLVILPVLIAVLLFTLASNRVARFVAVGFQGALFAASLFLVWETREAEIVTFVGSYVDTLGIILRVNSLSAIFLLLTTFIFLAVSIYAFASEQEGSRTFWFLMFLLEASFIGLFLSGDLFNIFVLIEVSTLVTVILAMYDRKWRNMFHGKVFLTSNVVSVQFYLLGLGYIYRLTGAMDIVRVRETLAGMDSANLVLPYVLIMTAVAFKNTLIPFFSWTPKVRIYPSAPTVVAAVMSGIQAKTSLYLFITFQDIFAPVAAREFFLVVGVITGVFGAFMAVCQTHIKSILAYHTVSQIGLITVGFSLPTDYAYVGALYHIISHAMFKTPLFLCAGIIIRSYQTADIREIRGVARRMPLVSAATLAAVFGITGMPFFIGSASKYFIFGGSQPYVLVLSILMGLGTVISFVKFSTIFYGPSEKAAPPPEKAKTIPVVVMGALCLLGGVFGTQLIYFLFRYPVAIDGWGYFYKSLIFAAYAGAGYLVYNYSVKENTRLTAWGKKGAGFQAICAGMGVFMAVMLGLFML